MPTGRSTWRPPGEPIAITIGEYQDRQISAIEDVIVDYHHALDTRHNGDVAAHNALNAIEAIMGMYWKYESKVTTHSPNCGKGGYCELCGTPP